MPTLLVLAAGMGSRYGGLKQLDAMGPSGETLMDYSIYDALRAGFDRIVFVIRRDFESEFREQLGRRYEKRVEVGYVFQEMEFLPAGFSAIGREKPWGTGHAIWCAREQIRTSFAVINADDFYGASAYRSLCHFSWQSAMRGAEDEFAMVGYQLGRTLSEHGNVSRGICQVDSNSFLTGIRECVGLKRSGKNVLLNHPYGSKEVFTGLETVSMNCWYFTKAIFPILEVQLGKFLQEQGREAKSEFYIPNVVAEAMASKTARVRVLHSESDWFGVTYREDKPRVAAALNDLVKAGEYPRDLWSPVIQSNSVLTHHV